jgi:predicted nucleotidyltransferase
LNVLQQALEIQPQVVFAYVYGSFLEDRPFHDIDVAVYIDAADEGDTPFFPLDLASSLEKLLSQSCDPEARSLPVDVRLLNRAPRRFSYHVFQGKLLVSRNEELRAQCVEQAVSHYLDLKPLRLRALKEAMVT